MNGGLKVSEFADGVAATAATLGVAAAASGIGLPLVPVLEGVAIGSKAGSVITDLFGGGIGSSKMHDWGSDEDDSLYEDLQNAVQAVGRVVGIDNKAQATQIAKQAYMALVDAKGVEHLDYDEYYSGLSPNKLMQSIGVDTGPEADDGITPRTMQFVSEGIQSPPAGPGMTRGSGLSATQVVAAAQNLRENPHTNQLYEQRLFRREQAADAQFVSSLEHAAHDSFKSTPRRSKGQKITPVEQAQQSRGQLKYYHGPRFRT
jgi:hypothetical protein